MRIKILFTISTLASSGPPNVLYNIVKYLDRTMFEPTILTLSPEPTNSRIKDFEALGVTVRTLRKSRWYWMFSSMSAFKDLVAEIQPDIVHSHSFRADVSSARHLKGYCRISTVHADLLTSYKDSYNYLFGKYLETKQIRSIDKLEQAVACSASVAAHYRSILNRIFLIRNGVDTEIFFPAPDKHQLREKLSLAVQKKIFITAGALRKLKDPETVIKGFLQSEVANDAILLILGSGVLEDSLKEKYGHHPNIIFKGFIERVNDYMMASDFFISGSTSEGLPNSVLEAVGCGLPVCLSDIPAHREIFDINPAAGFLFSCGSSTQLANRINQISKSGYADMQNACQDIIQHDLTAEKMTRQYQSQYLSLLKK